MSHNCINFAHSVSCVASVRSCSISVQTWCFSPLNPHSKWYGNTISEYKYTTVETPVMCFRGYCVRTLSRRWTPDPNLSPTRPTSPQTSEPRPSRTQMTRPASSAQIPPLLDPDRQSWGWERRDWAAAGRGGAWVFPGPIGEQDGGERWSGRGRRQETPELQDCGRWLKLRPHWETRPLSSAEEEQRGGAHAVHQTPRETQSHASPATSHDRHMMKSHLRIELFLNKSHWDLSYINHNSTIIILLINCRRGRPKYLCRCISSCSSLTDPIEGAVADVDLPVILSSGDAHTPAHLRQSLILIGVLAAHLTCDTYSEGGAWEAKRQIRARRIQSEDQSYRTQIYDDTQ